MEPAMRQFLFSTTALVLLAMPAFAQPGSNESHSSHVGKASVAPQVQERAQAQLRGQNPQPQAPQQQGGRFDRGHDRGPAPQASVQAPPNRGDQNRGRDRGSDRGDNGRHMGWDRQDNRRAFNDNRTDNRPNNRFDNRSDNRNFNRDSGFNRDFNRDGRTDFRQGRGAGPRHDFSGFRDYHRDFHVSRRFYAPAYRRPAGWFERRWTYGQILPAAFWVRDYWLIDFADYDLPPPPYGAIWVRVGSDALLIDEDSGEIITVAYDVFY
jgi:Ni/Co efflux regulator RcnB